MHTALYEMKNSQCIRNRNENKIHKITHFVLDQFQSSSNHFVQDKTTTRPDGYLMNPFNIPPNNKVHNL